MLEPLTLRILYDVSILEIFANERTVITTRVYPSNGSSTEIRPFVEYEDGIDASAQDCKLLSGRIWKLISRT